MLRQTPVSAISLIYCVCIFNLVVFNLQVYGYITSQATASISLCLMLLVLISCIIFSFTFLLMTVLALISQVLLKGIMIMLLISNSVAIYFMSTYQVILDKSMMGNVLNTRFSEAGDFVSLSLFIYLLVLGVLPAAIIVRLKTKSNQMIGYLSHVVLQFIITSVLAYSLSSTWLWIDQHAKQLGGRIMPWSYLANTGRYLAAVHQAQAELTRLPSFEISDPSRKLVVLVIGETARSHNFSLYGYERMTNPLLSKLPVQSLPEASSCSTYTTASLQCILSHQSTGGFWEQTFEPLPTYLSRQGVNVIWRTNNWGEPKISVNTYTEANNLRSHCAQSDCDYDGVLLTGLDELIKQSNEDKIFLVLHQKGSHGPLYNERYPAEFAFFKPECKSVDLAECSDEELMNSYDNSIMYTDHFLATVIEVLSHHKQYQSTLIYVSDHGESLGEGGLYLHGTPISMAPEYQYKIPFIVWNSSQTPLNLAIESYSQANVFHTVMGSLGLTSPFYDPKLDVFDHQLNQNHAD